MMKCIDAIQTMLSCFLALKFLFLVLMYIVKGEATAISNIEVSILFWDLALWLEIVPRVSKQGKGLGYSATRLGHVPQKRVCDKSSLFEVYFISIGKAMAIAQTQLSCHLRPDTPSRLRTPRARSASLYLS
jgi:hypothetical protein